VPGKKRINTTLPKVCTVCGNLKQPTEFYVSGGHVKAECKTCARLRRKLGVLKGK